MPSFYIDLPVAHDRTIKMLRNIVLAMNAAGFILVAIYAPAGWQQILSIVIALCIVYSLIFKHRVLYTNRLVAIAAVVICSLGWLVAGEIFPAMFMFVFAVADWFTTRSQTIVFNDEAIIYPSFPPRKILWEEVDDLILNNDVLSITLQDGHFWQFVLSQHQLQRLDPEMFISWYKQKLCTS